MDTQLLYALAEHNGRRLRSPEEQNTFLIELLARCRAIIPETVRTPHELLRELRRLGWVCFEDLLTLRICAPLPYEGMVQTVEARIKETGKTPEELCRDTMLLPLLVGLYSEVGMRSMFKLLARPWNPHMDWEDWGNWVAEKGWIQRSPYRGLEGGYLYWIRPPAENLAADADKVA
ncbi:hypothetical protein KBD13_00015 [Patescibacteria group bacterium]|nr:hypothetical protein [Patescibacteria group bacterium]